MAHCLSMFYHICVSILLPTIIIAKDTFLTVEYGNQNGNHYSTLDQGRISQINNWGVDFTGIHIRDWRSDEQTEYSEIYGYGWYHQSCPSLNISKNDYIIGYKIYIDTTTYYVDDEDEEITMSMDIIRGLVFYTLKGDSYSCIEDASVESYTQIYTNYYLSGWNIYSQKVLNSIQFQFTQINANGPSMANAASNDDNDSESTPISANDDDIHAPSPSSTQNLDLNESMEINDDFDFFSSTVSSQSESAENPTETKYPQSEDSKDSPSSTSNSSQSAEDSQDIDDTSESGSTSEDNDNDASSDDINNNIKKSEIEQTQTILIDRQSIDDTTSTTKVIHAVEQDNDDRELSKKGISQYFQGTEGKVVVISTMLILAFTLILCCVLTICVINIKRKKRRHEANQSVIDGDLNLHEPSPEYENNEDNEVKLTIPTRRVGEKGTGQSSTNLSICSHDIQVSIDGIDGLDGMDGNDTMLHERPNNVGNLDIANLLSPRYGRRGTNESNGEWPINPVQRVNNQGIPIKNNKRKKRRPPVPLDHPYSIDWNEPQMQKLTDKMANLFNEEDNRNGSFISTVNTRNNKSRQLSQMTGITVSGHGSETDDAETDNDTDLMYNHLGPLSERKVTPETKGGDDEQEEEDEEEEEEEHEEEEEEEQSECLNVNKDGASPFNYVPRRNALKLLTVRSNTFGH